jgi:hypothetical protein
MSTPERVLAELQRDGLFDDFDDVIGNSCAFFQNTPFQATSEPALQVYLPLRYTHKETHLKVTYSFYTLFSVL